MSEKKVSKEEAVKEKEKALQIVKSLIGHCGAVLDTKYLHSHEKVAILYKEHVVEVIGGEEKFVKYMDTRIPLSKTEHKEIYKMFMDEVSKRKENTTTRKFNELRDLLSKKS